MTQKMQIINNEKTQNEDSIKSQLDDIVRKLKTDCKEWNQYHLSGWPLVNDLSRMHSKCLTMSRNLQKYETQRRLNQEKLKLRRTRSEIQKISDRLFFVLNRLLDATERTRESLILLRKLCRTQSLSEKIFYRNWQLQDILEFAESIMRLYDAEYEIKEMVAEELTNCKDQEEVQLVRQAWREPRHALTKEFKTLFKEFSFETVNIKV